MSSKEFISKINVKDEKCSADYENDNHESTAKIELNEDDPNMKNWSDFTKNLPITITPKNKTSKLNMQKSSEFKRDIAADFKVFQKENFDLKNHPGGVTELHQELEKKNLERIKCKISIGAQINSKMIHRAAYMGHLEIVKFLTENGGNVNAKNNVGATPTHNAISKGHLEIVKLLIEKGAEIDAKNNKDMTPIHIAASKGYLEIIKYLTENGAKIDLKTKKDMNPFHIVASEGNLEVVKYLAAKGANVNAKGREDWVPIHYAAFFGHLEVVKYLAENGAEIQAQNKHNKTPFDLANNCGHIEIVDYLRMKESQQDDIIPEESISNKAPCILCMLPRNGLYALSPCGHTSLCKSCCVTVISKKFAKCPTCEKPVKDYMKIFFEVPESS